MKIRNIFIGIILILLIALGGLYYLLIPNEKVEIENVDNVKTEDVLKNAHLENFNLKLTPPKVQGDVVISEDSLQKGLPVILKKLSPNNYKPFLVKLDEDNFKIFMPYKLFDTIDTQFEATAHPTIESGDIKLHITECKVGKIKLSEGMIKKALQNLADENSKLVVRDDYILISKEEIDPISVKSIKINSKEVKLNIDINGYDIIKDIEKYGLHMSF